MRIGDSGNNIWRGPFYRQRKLCSHSSQPPLPAVPRLGQWPRVHAPKALAGAQGLARMEPIQQPASRCLPKQSSRLEREQRAGKGDRNLIAYH